MKNLFSFFILIVFLIQTLIPSVSLAQNLPLPIQNTVQLSQPFTPPLVRGLSLYPDNPLKFDFIIDAGEDELQGKAFEQESMKLIKYFLTSLTIPEGDMWVNLSPTDKDRIIPKEFGLTNMGQDMLAQDYLLKQLTASLMNPDEKLGQEFWQKVYRESAEKFGTTEIPMDTLSKVWIIPEKAQVYVKDRSVYVVESYLKVLMEEEYLSGQWSPPDRQAGVISDQKNKKNNQPLTTDHLSLTTLKEIIIPALEHEVNFGKNFATLRQIQNSAILAAWYKKNLKETLLGQVYVDQKKTEDIQSSELEAAKKIYNQYIEAFKQGAYEMVKEEYNTETQEVITRKYVSGGVLAAYGNILADSAMSTEELALDESPVQKVTWGLGSPSSKNFETTIKAADKSDKAQLTTQEQEELDLLKSLQKHVDQINFLDVKKHQKYWQSSRYLRSIGIYDLSMQEIWRKIRRKYSEPYEVYVRLLNELFNRYSDLRRLLDMRLVDNILLGVPFVGFDMAVKRIVNPDNSSKTVVSLDGASGISDVLLSTNATEVYMIDLYSNDEHFEDGINPDISLKYLSHKYFKGFSYGYDGGGLRGISFIEALIVELKALGVTFEDERAFAEDCRRIMKKGEGLKVEFNWAYHGQPVQKRTIHFIDGNSLDPKTYQDQIPEHVNIVYQKAGLQLPLHYDTIVSFFNSRMKEGDFYILDNNFIDNKNDKEGVADPTQFFPKGHFLEIVDDPFMEYWAQMLKPEMRQDKLGGYGAKLTVYKRVQDKVTAQPLSAAERLPLSKDGAVAQPDVDTTDKSPAEFDKDAAMVVEDVDPNLPAEIANLDSVRNNGPIKISYPEEGIVQVMIDQRDIIPINAVSRPVQKDLIAIIRHNALNPNVVGTIVTGAGRLAFIAGLDFREVQTIQSDDEVKADARLLQELANAIEQSSKPVVAAMNGASIGVGGQLALAFHARIMARKNHDYLEENEEDNYVQHREVPNGFFPAGGVLVRLPRKVGPKNAFRFFLQPSTFRREEAQRFYADELKAMGYVDEVVDFEKLQQAAINKLRRLAKQDRSLWHPDWDVVNAEQREQARNLLSDPEVIDWLRVQEELGRGELALDIIKIIQASYEDESNALAKTDQRVIKRAHRISYTNEAIRQVWASERTRAYLIRRGVDPDQAMIADPTFIAIGSLTPDEIAVAQEQFLDFYDQLAKLEKLPSLKDGEINSIFATRVLSERRLNYLAKDAKGNLIGFIIAERVEGDQVTIKKFGVHPDHQLEKVLTGLLYQVLKGAYLQNIDTIVLILQEYPEEVIEYVSKVGFYEITTEGEVDSDSKAIKRFMGVASMLLDEIIYADNPPEEAPTYDEKVLNKQDSRSPAAILLKQPDFIREYYSSPALFKRQMAIWDQSLRERRLSRLRTMDDFMVLLGDFFYDMNRYRNPLDAVESEFRFLPDGLKDVLLYAHAFSQRAYSGHPQAKDARHFLWKLGARHFKDDLRYIKESERAQKQLPFPLKDELPQDEVLRDKPILDLTAGLTAESYFEDMRDEHMVLADSSFFWEAYMVASKQHYNIGDNIEIRRVDIRDLDKLFQGEYRMIRLGSGIDRFVRLPLEFYQRAKKHLASGGVITADLQLNSVQDPLNKEFEHILANQLGDPVKTEEAVWPNASSKIRYSVYQVDPAMLVAAGTHVIDSFTGEMRYLGENSDREPRTIISNRIITMRHAESGWNAKTEELLRQGGVEALNHFYMTHTREEMLELVKLSDNGKRQAQQGARILFDKLKKEYGEDLDKWRALVIVVSTLLRTQQTAQYFVDLVKEETAKFSTSGGVPVVLEIQIDERADETHHGKTQDLSELQRKEYEEALLRFRETRDVRVKTPVGEDFIDVVNRSEEMFLELDQRHPNQTVILFSHGGSINAAKTLFGHRDILKKDEGGNDYVDYRGFRIPNAKPFLLYSPEQLELGYEAVRKQFEDTAMAAQAGEHIIDSSTGVLNYQGEDSEREPKVKSSNRIIATRHGKTLWNEKVKKVFRVGGAQAFSQFYFSVSAEEKRALGRLSEEGRRQAQRGARILFDKLKKEFGEDLEKWRDLVIVASALERTQQTAQFFVDLVKEETAKFSTSSGESVILEILIDKRVNELSYGEVDGLSDPELERFKAILEQHRSGRDVTLKTSVGDSFKDVINRNEEMLLDLDKEHPNKTILLFGHERQLNAVKTLFGHRDILKIGEDGKEYVDYRGSKLTNGQPFLMYSPDQLKHGYEAIRKQFEDAAMAAQAGEHIIDSNTGLLSYQGDDSEREPKVKSRNRIIAMRHGESGWNAKVEKLLKTVSNAELMQFYLTVSREEKAALSKLSDKGKKQARRGARILFDRLKREFGEDLEKWQALVVVASAFERTQQTAQFFIDLVKEETAKFSTSNGQPVILEMKIDERANEITRGESKGLSGAELKAYESTMQEIQKTQSVTIKTSVGESFKDVIDRNEEMLLDLDKEHPNKTILLFGHERQLNAVKTLFGHRDALKKDEGGNDYVDYRGLRIPNAEPFLMYSPDQLKHGYEAIRKQFEDAAMLSDELLTDEFSFDEIIGWIFYSTEEKRILKELLDVFLRDEPWDVKALNERFLDLKERWYEAPVKDKKYSFESAVAEEVFDREYEFYGTPQGYLEAFERLESLNEKLIIYYYVLFFTTRHLKQFGTNHSSERVVIDKEERKVLIDFVTSLKTISYLVKGLVEDAQLDAKIEEENRYENFWSLGPMTRDSTYKVLGDFFGVHIKDFDQVSIQRKMFNSREEAYFAQIIRALMAIEPRDQVIEVLENAKQSADSGNAQVNLEGVLAVLKDEKSIAEVVGDDIDAAMTTETPAHWQDDWQSLPDQEEFDLVDAFWRESRTMTLSERRGGDLFLARASQGEEDSYAQYAKILRAMYYRYPELAGILLLSVTEGHGYLAAILDSKDGIQDNIESTMIAAIINQGIKDYLNNSEPRKRGIFFLRNPQFEGEEVRVIYNFSGIGGFMGYVHLEKSLEIVASVEDAYLPELIEAMVTYTLSSFPAIKHKDAVKAVLKNIPRDRVTKAWDDLDPKTRDYLRDIGTVPAAEDAEGVAASRGGDSSPAQSESGEGESAHWQEHWPLPNLDALAKVDEFLAAGFEMVMGEGLGDVFRRRFIKEYNQEGFGLGGMFLAIYYRYPDVASSVFMGFNNHGNASDLIASLYRDTEISHQILNEMTAQTINRGYELERSGKSVVYQNDVLARPGEMRLRVMEVIIKEDVIVLIEDRFLEKIVNQLITYIDTKSDAQQRDRERALDRLKSIPPERLRRIQSQLTPEARQKLTELKLLEELPPVKLEYVDASTSVIPGRAVGKLVVIREEDPSIETLTQVPPNSILALPLLRTSALAVGPFRGLVEFVETGHTTHSHMKARALGIPLALMPGAESIEALESETVYYETRMGEPPVLRRATAAEIEAFERERLKKRERSAVEAAVPQARLDGDAFSLEPGDSRLAEPEEVGYKIALLNQMPEALLSTSDPKVKVRIARHGALPFRFLAEVLRQNDLYDQYVNYAAKLKEAPPADVSVILQEIRSLIDKIPFELGQGSVSNLFSRSFNEWFYSALEKGVFFRGSMTSENIPSHPELGSGVYVTIPNEREKIGAAIKEVWKSLWSYDAYLERQRYGIDPLTDWPAVGLFESVPGDYSFMLRTLADGRDSMQFYTEIAQGLGAALVSDNPKFAGAPTRIYMTKNTHRIVEAHESEKKRKVMLGERGGTYDEETDPSLEFLKRPDYERVAKGLADIGHKIQGRFGGVPVEVEGRLSYDADKDEWTITLLQIVFMKPTDAAMTALEENPAYEPFLEGLRPAFEVYKDRASEYTKAFIFIPEMVESAVEIAKQLAERIFKAMALRLLPQLNPQGRDLRVYYPAAGFDLVNVLAATDATEIIMSDLNQDMGGVKDLPILPNILEQVEALVGKGNYIYREISSKTFEITFDLKGVSGEIKKRKIVYDVEINAVKEVSEEAKKGFDVLFLPGVYVHLWAMEHLKPGGKAVISHPFSSEVVQDKFSSLFNHFGRFRFIGDFSSTKIKSYTLVEKLSELPADMQPSNQNTKQISLFIEYLKDLRTSSRGAVAKHIKSLAEIEGALTQEHVDQLVEYLYDVNRVVRESVFDVLKTRVPHEKIRAKLTEGLYPGNFKDSSHMQDEFMQYIVWYYEKMAEIGGGGRGNELIGRALKLVSAPVKQEGYEQELDRIKEELLQSLRNKIKPRENLNFGQALHVLKLLGDAAMLEEADTAMLGKSQSLMQGPLKNKFNELTDTYVELYEGLGSRKDTRGLQRKLVNQIFKILKTERRDQMLEELSRQLAVYIIDAIISRFNPSSQLRMPSEIVRSLYNDLKRLAYQNGFVFSPLEFVEEKEGEGLKPFFYNYVGQLTLPVSHAKRGKSGQKQIFVISMKPKTELLAKEAIAFDFPLGENITVVIYPDQPIGENLFGIEDFVEHYRIQEANHESVHWSLTTKGQGEAGADSDKFSSSEISKIVGSLPTERGKTGIKQLKKFLVKYYGKSRIELFRLPDMYFQYRLVEFAAASGALHYTRLEENSSFEVLYRHFYSLLDQGEPELVARHFWFTQLSQEIQNESLGKYSLEEFRQDQEEIDSILKSIQALSLGQNVRWEVKSKLEERIKQVVTRLLSFTTPRGLWEINKKVFSNVMGMPVDSLFVRTKSNKEAVLALKAAVKQEPWGKEVRFRDAAMQSTAEEQLESYDLRKIFGADLDQFIKWGYFPSEILGVLQGKVESQRDESIPLLSKSDYTAQSIMIREKTREILRKKIKLLEAEEQTEFVIYAIGLGQEPQEALDLVRIVGTEAQELMRAQGIEDTSRLKIRFVGLDANLRHVLTAIQGFKGELERLEKSGITNVLMTAEHANAFIKEELVNARDHDELGAGLRADLIVNRNVHYGNVLIASHLIAPLEEMDSPSGRVIALQLYLMIKNIFETFGQEGIYYVTERIPKNFDRDGRFLQILGAISIRDREGVYEINDPNQINSFEMFLQNLVQPSLSSRVDAAMIGDSEPEMIDFNEPEVAAKWEKKWGKFGIPYNEMKEVLMSIVNSDELRETIEGKIEAFRQKRPKFERGVFQSRASQNMAKNYIKADEFRDLVRKARYSTDIVDVRFNLLALEDLLHRLKESYKSKIDMNMTVVRKHRKPFIGAGQNFTRLPNVMKIEVEGDAIYFIEDEDNTWTIERQSNPHTRNKLSRARRVYVIGQFIRSVGAQVVRLSEKISNGEDAAMTTEKQDVNDPRLVSARLVDRQKAERAIKRINRSTGWQGFDKAIESIFENTWFLMNDQSEIVGYFVLIKRKLSFIAALPGEQNKGVGLRLMFEAMKIAYINGHVTLVESYNKENEKLVKFFTETVAEIAPKFEIYPNDADSRYLDIHYSISNMEQIMERYDEVSSRDADAAMATDADPEVIDFTQSSVATQWESKWHNQGISYNEMADVLLPFAPAKTLKDSIRDKINKHRQSQLRLRRSAFKSEQSRAIAQKYIKLGEFFELIKSVERFLYAQNRRSFWILEDMISRLRRTFKAQIGLDMDAVRQLPVYTERKWTSRDEPFTTFYYNDSEEVMLLLEYPNGRWEFESSLKEELLTELMRTEKSYIIGHFPASQGARVIKLPVKGPAVGDPAMTAETPGGIDLNANESIIEEQGEKMKLDIPPPSFGVQSQPINRFVPFIIQISPPTTIPALLGLNTLDEPSEQVSLSSLN